MNRRDFIKKSTIMAGGLLLSCNKSLSLLSNIDNIVFDPTIPEYYFKDNYLEQKISRITSLIYDNDSTNAFVFITDQHWEHNSQKSLALLKHIQEKTKISKLFSGGDVADLFGKDSYAYIKLLKEAWNGEIHCAVGNHEYLGTNNSTEQKVYELFKTNPDIQKGNQHRHYYYVDDSSVMTRYVVLSSYSQSIDGGLHATFGYGEEQEKWLQNVALKVDKEWKIIIFTHLLFFIGVDDDKITVCDDKILSIIDNYNSDGQGKVVAIFHGHNHRDRIIYTPVSKIPVIVTTCDKYEILHDDQQNVVRTPGTIDEQAFDVVVIDYETKTIHCVRIGCKAKDGVNDDVGSEVEERVIKYE